MNNNASLIASQLDKIGNTAHLKDGGWVSTPFKACVFRLWNKQRSAFEPDITEIGSVTSDYYLYIGPADHDITALSEEVTLLTNGGKYEFKRRNAFEVGDEALYYTGILRKIQGESDYED
ncbi:MAG: hypothetical protein ACI4IQ_07035 [Eubacterium sp.]